MKNALATTGVDWLRESADSCPWTTMKRRLEDQREHASDERANSPTKRRLFDQITPGIGRSKNRHSRKAGLPRDDASLDDVLRAVIARCGIADGNIRPWAPRAANRCQIGNGCVALKMRYALSRKRKLRRYRQLLQRAALRHIGCFNTAARPTALPVLAGAGARPIQLNAQSRILRKAQHEEIRCGKTDGIR